VTVCPAIVTLALRGEAEALAAIESCACPGPVPNAPLIKLMNEDDVDPVHWHEAGVETFTVTVFAAPDTEKTLLSIEYPQAACVIGNACPPIVNVALRGDGPVLPETM
jgi:hypothetical protein